MGTQLTSNAEALRLFFTEDIYLVDENNEIELTSFKYLGANQKNILILVNDPKNDVSTLEGRELLRKLVKAIELAANDFALVNYANYASEKYKELKDFFNCTLMIAFGVTPTDLDLPSQPMHQLVNHEGTMLLFAKNLHDLDADQASKKILWASLQQLK